MKPKRVVILILGLLLTVLASFLYFSGNHYWYNYLVVGIWFLFDTLSSLRGNKTTWDLLFKRDYSSFFKIFGVLFVIGLLIEVILHFILRFWYYPFVNPIKYYIFSNILGFLMYPLILISFKEMHSFVNSFINQRLFSVLASMLLGILIWEIPNVYSKDWIYTIPYVKSELFGVNLIVILGWAILILAPIYVYRYFGRD